MGEWKEMEIQEGLIDIIDYRGKTPPKSNIIVFISFFILIIIRSVKTLFVRFALNMLL